MLNLKKLLTNILLRDIRTVKETVSVPAISPGGYTNVAVSAPATDPDESIIGWRLIAKDGAYRYARDLEIKEKDRRNNMEKVTLSFSAKGQSLTGCPFKFASNTVNYIEAKFELGENWGGFDSVRAVWFTDFNCISTVLDTDGVCVVPHEVLNKAKREVKVNLVGSIVENGELTDRLTTYPIKAIIIDANAKICGSETAEVTPSQFEQFVEAVKAEVAKIKDIDSVELNDDYTLTIYFSDDTETTVGPIRGEQGPAGPQGEQGETGNGIASIEKTGTAGYVDTYTITFTDGTTTTFEVRNGEVSLETLESLMPIDTASGDIASFPDGQNVFPLKSLVADIDPIQDLSHGDPSPTNICPISGHTEVNVVRTGKNLVKVSADSLDNSQKSTSVITDSGITVTATGTYGRRMDVFTVEIGKTYTLSFKGESDGDFHCVYVQSAANWSNASVIARLYPETTEGSFSYTFTATTNVLALGWYVTASASSGYMTIKDLQLELGSTATSYEPYNGQTYNTTLPSTTYGGNNEFVSGVLTSTMGYKTISMSQGEYKSGIGALLFYSSLNILADAKAPPNNNTAINAISDSVEVKSASAINSGSFGIGVSKTKDIYLKVSGLSSKADYVSAFPNGLVICYELATPQTYQLTPQEIQTLLGVNNIWADSGDVEVVYIADIKLYVDNH